jgi:hypothetical protein
MIHPQCAEKQPRVRCASVWRRERKMKEITAFTWGYWGWGTHTKEFVRVFRPPIFVDIRLSRKVRAPGFREGAFESVLGCRRYCWLRKLGNARIGSGKSGIRILDPGGVEDLLQIVVDAARERRRVIFFCARKDVRRCHRARVARLLLKTAGRRKIRLSVVEWPGGEPKTISLPASPTAIRDLVPTGVRIPLDGISTKDLPKLGSLPWGSRVTLRSDEGSITVISGPAKLGTRWYLPVIGPARSKATDRAQNLKKTAERIRKQFAI